MLMKLLGAVLVLACCGGLGFSQSAALTRVTKELRELQRALFTLRGEIAVCRTPLGEALARCAGGLKTAAAQILTRAAACLDEGLTAGEAWERAVLENRSLLFMKQAEAEAVAGLGALLEAPDAQAAEASLTLAGERVGLLAAQSAEREQRLGKLFRGLGILSGVFLVIILI